MPKAVSNEERIVTFFTEAPLEGAKTMFNVVKGIMTTRTPKTTPKTRITNKNKLKAEQVKAAAAGTDETASEGS